MAVLLAGIVLFRPIVIMFALITLGAISIIYKRYVSIGIDLELCSFCAVAVGSVYGAKAGALSGGISMLAALILNGHAMQNALFAAIKILTVSFLGIIAAATAGGHLVLVATLYTFLADALFVFIAVNTGGNLGNLAVFLVTHTLFVVYQLNFLLPLVKTIM